MKKSILFTLLFIGINSFAQEHFTGLTGSNRVGILNLDVNPAELVNMSHTFDVNIYGLSFNVSNNKIGFKDITSGSNLEDLIFKGADPVNMRVDTEIYGPAFAMKYKTWAFGISTKVNAKLDLVDVDSKLGDALLNNGANSGLSALLSSTSLNNNYNQRVNGTTWGEIGFTVSKSLLNTNSHKFNVGATFKILLPGAYANLGLDKYKGTINNVGGNLYLTNTEASMNIAYSGGLTNSFTNFDDYSKSLIGGVNGFSGDIGINYQWKGFNSDEADDDNKSKTGKKNKYKINIGAAIRNIGSMTFKESGNYSTNYNFNTEPNSLNPNPLGLDLNLFNNVNSLKEVETILLNNGYLTQTNRESEFNVKLPTTLNVYADLKVISKLYVSGFMQKKVNQNSANDQITAQDVITVTPRINLGFFEFFVPVSNKEISGLNAGVGFRLGGFYLGSGSIISAVLNDTKHADVYTGFRWTFL